MMHLLTHSSHVCGQRGARSPSYLSRHAFASPSDSPKWIRWRHERCSSLTSVVTMLGLDTSRGLLWPSPSPRRQLLQQLLLVPQRPLMLRPLPELVTPLLGLRHLPSSCHGQRRPRPQPLRLQRHHAPVLARQSLPSPPLPLPPTQGRRQLQLQTPPRTVCGHPHRGGRCQPCVMACLFAMAQPQTRHVPTLLMRQERTSLVWVLLRRHRGTPVIISNSTRRAQRSRRAALTLTMRTALFGAAVAHLLPMLTARLRRELAAIIPPTLQATAVLQMAR